MPKVPKKNDGKIYKVLIKCRNSGKQFLPGDTVTSADFPKRVIENWLEINPPVLELVEGEMPDEEHEVTDGKSGEEQITPIR